MTGTLNTDIAAPSGAHTSVDQPKAKRRAFRVVSWLAALIGLGLFIFGLMEVVLTWLPDETLMTAIDDELTPADMLHRAHWANAGVLAWLVVPVLLAQLRKPDRRVAQLLQGLAVSAVSLLLFAVSGAPFVPDAILFAAFVALAVLHPRSRELFRTPVLHRGQFALAAIAAPAVLYHAFHQLGLQMNHAAGDIHGADGHYTLVAVAAVGIVIAAVVGATDHDGWRLSAWLVSLLTIELGVHALTYADLPGSIPGPFAIASVAWGVVYLGVTIRRSRTEKQLAFAG